MTNAEKWNLIVAGYKRLYSQPEAKVQAEWEMYCTELFDYKKILHEIDSQRHLTIGSGGSIIPDIILCKNGQDIFDIELKQYSLSFNDAFEKQLISYLNMTHLSVGMIVCSRIYLYYYNYSEISVNKIEIPFEKDDPDGISLMDMLTKDTFSTEKIKEYVAEKIRRQKSLAEIKQSLTADFIKEAVRDRLSKDFAEREIDEVLADYSFKPSPFHITPSAPKPGPVIAPGPVIPVEPIDDDVLTVIHSWCEKKTQRGELCFWPDKSARKYTRFTTADLDEIFPYRNDLKSGWGDGHFYMYEIVYSNNRISMHLAFNNNNTPDEFTALYTRIMKVTGLKPQKEQWQWWDIFSTPYFECTNITKAEEIYNALDERFVTVRTNVETLIKELSN